ncbi:TetR/AcrR family transcriptional regulator [Dactylosporangium aurantiacum]|uniref:TetR/AcrR family transcriptional regulator n=1 Tax=Dactylosporangium aurantiacum TaxID=35754 RepID=A0A9Q9MDG6_9ACTN|nr:TetR/AcrR family transcriptional regulator [Dactylosporangium aurantiacum]MDG6100868.1 TetR/AcrR family transcriptional regulator [Dactylosporangium aurantiacum]UWZ55073.1 TetR/AcrR family transcriptional regulator [Dactylosporangium aurantiacum]
MGRPRGFDEKAVTRAAVRLFAARAYAGLSVDDLVNGLGVHRNSLYKTFGSKRGLYLTALRWYLAHELEPLLAAGDIEALLDGAALDLLLLAAVEQAPGDPEVAALLNGALARLDAALGQERATGLLGRRLRARIDVSDNKG